MDRVTAERSHTYAASFMLPSPLNLPGLQRGHSLATVLPTYWNKIILNHLASFPLQIFLRNTSYCNHWVVYTKIG